MLSYILKILMIYGYNKLWPLYHKPTSVLGTTFKCKIQSEILQNTVVAPIITSMNEISTYYETRRVYSSMELVLVGLGDKATLRSRTIGASNVIDMANDSRNENTTLPKYKDIWNKTNIHLSLCLFLWLLLFTSEHCFEHKKIP